MAVLTVALVGLGGCSLLHHPAPAPKPEPEAPAPVAEAPPEEPPVPEHKPKPPPLPAPAPQVAKIEPPPPAATPPLARPEVQVIGLDPAALERTLGPPAAHHDSPLAIVWEYADGDCAVDIYLYRDVQSGTLRSLTVDVKGDDQSDERRRTCLGRFAEHAGNHGDGRPDAAAAR